MAKILISILIALLPNIAMAAFYKCKDSSGHVTYSDAPCSASGLQEGNPAKAQAAAVAAPAGANNSAEPSAPASREAYTKDMPALQAPDAASKSCFSYHNTTQNYPDPSTSRLLASRKKWVSVKDVGARQMMTIVVTSKNIEGMYVGKQSYDCLLMGDGATVNSKPYELL